MRRNSIALISILLAAAFVFSGCGNIGTGGIKLVDAKIVTEVDENLMPVKVTDTFPRGTNKVSCWISWKNARINTEILTSWHYITDDLHILDNSFVIPKREGTGSVVLSMPESKNFPSGEYKVELISGKTVLKKLRFRIE